MEALVDEYISPYTADLNESPEDYTESGELTEQGKEKLQTVQHQNYFF